MAVQMLMRPRVSVAQSLGAVNLTGLDAPVSTVALTSIQPGGVTAGGNLAISAGRDLSLATAPVAAGGSLSLAAGRDLSLTASAVSAGGDAQLLAGRDLSLNTASHVGGISDAAHATVNTTHTASTISAGGTLAVAAGRDITSQGAQLSAGRQLGVSAGRDIALDAVTDKSFTGSGQESGHHFATQTQSDDTLRGTTLSGANGVSVGAGRDIAATAGSLSSANGAVTLGAGRDLSLNAGTENHDTTSYTYSHSDGLLSSSTTTTHDATQTRNAIGTTVSGDSVTLAAGHDLTAQAAQIAGTHDVTLAAGNDLSLTTADSTYSASHDKSVSQSGLMGAGVGVMIGESQLSQGSTLTQTTPTGTLVGSTAGSVMLSAGHDVAIHGSDVISQTGTTIVGQNVTIDAALGRTDTTQTQKQSSAGLTVGLTGGAASVAQNLDGAAHGASQSSDARVKELYAAQAAQTLFSPGAGQGMGLAPGQTGAGALAQAAQGNTAGMSLRIGIGGSSASSQASTHDQSAYGSQITSQGDVMIAATNGDLNVVGSQISGSNVALAASNNINLLSQAEQHSDTSSSHSSSGEIGYSMGAQTGVYATASAAHGQGTGNGTTYADSQITASNTLSLISGNDTTIEGAQAKGNTVLASVGGNLAIASQQTTDTYNSSNAQVGGTFVYGAGGSLNVSQGKTNSSYASVDQISGIGAGSGGYDIVVGGNTDLKGGVLASSADPNLNLLSTGTLTTSDIQNQASYRASQEGISAGYSSSGGGLGNSGFSASPGGLAVPQSGNASSVTRAGIAQSTIDIRNNPSQDVSGLDRNPSLDASGLAPIFNAQKVADNQLAGQLAGQVGMTAAGDVEQHLNLAPGSAGATALHTVVGGAIATLGGGNALQGALGAGAGEAASGTMADYLANHGTDPNSAEGRSLMNLGSAAIGAAVGGGTGAATALQGDQYNRQLHPSEQQLAQTLAAKSNGLYTTQQIEDAMRLSGYSLGSGSVMPGETSQTGSLINVNDSRSIYDTQASWLLVPGPSGSQYLMQQMPSQVSPDLAAYITANTGGTTSPYAWAPEQQGLPSQNSGPLAIVNWASSNQVGTRALGGLQVLGGELEMAGGAAAATTCETGFGCAAAMYLGGAGLDNAMAGANTFTNGQPTTTLGQQGLQTLGLSPNAAALIYGATQLVPAGVDAYAANSAVNAEIATNQMALSSYQPFVPGGITPTAEVMSTPQAQLLISQIQAGSPGLTTAEASVYASQYIESGSTMPTVGQALPGATLYKVVPKGDTISGNAPNLSNLPQKALAFSARSG